MGKAPTRKSNKSAEKGISIPPGVKIFLGSAAVALVAGLIPSALQVAGVISMEVAHVMLFLAWLIATITILGLSPRKYSFSSQLGMISVLSVVFLGIDRWTVAEANRKQGPGRSEGFLQVDDIKITEGFSLIAPSKQFGVNFYARNPGPGRIFDAVGYRSFYIQEASGHANRTVKERFELDIAPFREQYMAGERKGVELGVRGGFWTTVLTHPLTPYQTEGILKGTVRLYYVSWLAWRNSRQQPDSAYHCVWLQAPDYNPIPPNRAIWQNCEDPMQ